MNHSMSNGESEILVICSPEYVEARSKPDKNLYFFAYQIQIINQGKRTVRLISRHWTITDEGGNQEEVRGLGVVGSQPSLGPGDSYSYMSFCPLSTPVGTMEGSYEMLADDGERFDAPIPQFSLVIPNLMN